MEKMPDIHQIIVDDIPIGAITLQRECHVISKEIRTVSMIMYDTFPAGHIISGENNMETQILNIKIHPGEEVVDIIERILISKDEMKPFDNKTIQLIDVVIIDIEIICSDTNSDACINTQVTFFVREK